MKKNSAPVQILIALFIALSFFFTGCATSAKFDYLRTTDFSTIKTYKWAPFAQQPEVKDEAIDFVKNEVDALLENKGLTESIDNPDMILSATIAKKQKLSINDLGMNLSPQQIDRVSYTEGALILIFLDAKNKSMVWWGAAKADLGKQMSNNKKKKRARKAVHMLLDNFPPAS